MGKIGRRTFNNDFEMENNYGRKKVDEERSSGINSYLGKLHSHDNHS
jgi:hypothetical protein